MKTLGLVCLVALAGCKSDKPAASGAVAGSGSGSAVVAGSGIALSYLALFVIMAIGHGPSGG